jgi:hypothetical protein
LEALSFGVLTSIRVLGGKHHVSDFEISNRSNI